MKRLSFLFVALVAIVGWLVLAPVDFAGWETVCARVDDGEAVSYLSSDGTFVDFGAILWVGDPLRDIVTESEGGKIAQLPSAGDVQQPEASPQVPPMAAWGYVAWHADGHRVRSRLWDDRDTCEKKLERDKEAAGSLIFSPCVEVRAVRETL